MTEQSPTDSLRGLKTPADRSLPALLLSTTAGRVALAVLVWIALCMLWVLSPWKIEPFGTWFTFYDLPIGPLIVILAWRVSRDVGLSARTRRGWLLIALAYLTYWLGNCTWNIYEAVLHIEPFPSLADAFFLAMYPLMFAGLVYLSEPLQSRRELIKFSLDVATVMVAAAAFIAYFILAQIEREEGQSLFELAILMAYPIGDTLIAFGVVSVLLKRQTARRNTAVELILMAQAVVFAADLIFLVQSSAGTYETGGLADLCFLLSFALMIFACLTQHQLGAGFEAVTHERQPYPYRLSPYAAVFAGYGLLVYDQVSTGAPISTVPLPTALILTSLVIARQVYSAREIAQLHAMQAERRAEARFASMVQNSSDVVLVADAGGTIRFATPAVERVLGWRAETLPGCKLDMLLHHDDIAGMQQYCREASTRPGISAPVEWRLRNKDDRWQHAEVIASNLLDDPTVSGLVLTCRDVTERKGLEERLRHMAFHDPLTFLPNRNLFNDRVHHALEKSSRQPMHVAVMFVDLDNFKNINDSLGHEMGDKLLIAIAERLRRVVRPHDTVARLGGDEFSILIEDFKNEADLSALAERIIDTLKMPVPLGSKQVIATGSIGIAVAGEEEHAHDVMRNADVAMYRAKAHGKASYEFFAAEMHTQVVATMELEMDLRRALQRKEFVVHYQPIVHVQSGQIVGVEALIRWRHPERGLVLPGEFIYVAEGSDLIVNMGRWMLFESCLQGRYWQETFPAEVLQHLAVNISARQLQQESFVEDVRAILQKTGIRPDTLVLEITESVLMVNVEKTLERLRALKALGVRLALDDFGTGYSSLSYLHQFPFDILKIDRTFVSQISEEAESDALVRTIASMGHSLGMTIVAEGVENAAQLTELRRLGCGYAQGWLFARAVPVEEAGRMLASLRAGPQLALVKSN